MTAFAGKRRQALSHRCIEPLNQRGVELLAACRQAQEVLCFLKRSPGELARDFHHPLLFRLLDHRRDTELGPYF